MALGATMFHFGTEGDFGGIWFNVLPGGNRRLSYHAIARAYGGPAGAAGVNTPPVFASMSVPTSVVAGSTFTVQAPVSDPQGDPITYSVLLNSHYVNKADGLARATFTPQRQLLPGQGARDGRGVEGVRLRRGRPTAT